PRAWPTNIPAPSKAALHRSRSAASKSKSSPAIRVLATAPRRSPSRSTGIPPAGRGPWLEIDCLLLTGRGVPLGRFAGGVAVLVYDVLHMGVVLVAGGVFHRRHGGLGAILLGQRRGLNGRGIEPGASRHYRQHQTRAKVKRPH